MRKTVRFAFSRTLPGRDQLEQTPRIKKQKKNKKNKKHTHRRLMLEEAKKEPCTKIHWGSPVVVARVLVAMVMSSITNLHFSRQTQSFSCDLYLKERDANKAK